MIRIIAGSARGRKIEAPPGLDTRPTLDRVRENIFNLLQGRLMDAAVLDLFSGSGAMALEALSRGAKEAVLVDHDAAAVRTERQNLKTLGMDDRARVLQTEAASALKMLGGQRFGLAFLDPPYEVQDLTAVTDLLRPLMAPGGRMVLEHRAGALPLIGDGWLALTDRRYGIAGVTIYTPAKENP